MPNRELITKQDEIDTGFRTMASSWRTSC